VSAGGWSDAEGLGVGGTGRGLERARPRQFAFASHHSLVPLIPQIPHSAYRDSSQTGQGFDAISSQRSAGSGVAQGIRGGTSVNRSLHSSRLLYTTKLQY
jgi:hypothetical protein